VAFSDFDLRTVVDTFGLREKRDVNLFPEVAPIEPSDHLRAWLDEFAPVAIAVNSEMARRELITGPLLMEAKRRAAGPVHVFPGMAFDGDKTRGLNGYCDYLIARSDEYYYLRSPLAAVVEAKREDLIPGLGQCAAAMLGIRIFNERDGTAFPVLHGCVSSGTNWRFLRLEGDVLSIDRHEYYLGDAGLLLGILVQIMGGPKIDGTSRAA
jgi:hypothetical protein